MEADIKVSPQLTQAIDAFKQSLAAAILSIPSVPASRDLASATPQDVDIFNNRPIEVTVDEKPALATWLNALTAKFNAFAKA
jgi:hypothetical protein